MATVADLLTLLDVKLLGFQDALTPAGLTPATENKARKIAVLNECYHAVWRVLVGLQKEFESYWFTKHVPSLTIGGGALDFNLPADFHDLLYIEIVSVAADSQVRFLPAGFRTPKFISQRHEQSVVDPVGLPDEQIVHYVTARGNPSRLHLGKAFAAGATAGYVYTYSLGNLDEDTDSIDDMMVPYQGPITSCAAEILLNAVHENGLAAQWGARYEKDVASMRLAAAERKPPSEGLREGVG